MSDLSVTGHNLAALMSGKITFAQFRDGELSLLKQNIASLPAPAQGAANVAAAALEAGASALVGVAQTVVGPILAESTDTQATQVLNLLGRLGVPTGGVLSIAEQAILSQVINGLKAGLDKIGLQVSTQGVVANIAPPPPAAEPDRAA